MTRHIKQLAGARAEFALADDNSIWLWTGTGWVGTERPPLPQPEHIPTMTLREEIDQKKADLVKELGIKPLDRESNTTQVIATTPEMKKALMEWWNDELLPDQSSQNPPAVKRGPGRPKKVQP